MEIIIKLLTVFGLGAVELWAAIPAGFAMRLPPLLTGLVSGFGAITGVVLVLTLGERLRSFLLRSHSQEGKSDKKAFIYRTWDRYGVIGLGLLAPILVGAPLGSAIGIALGSPVKRLLLWMSLGILLWDTILTAAGAGVIGLFKH